MTRPMIVLSGENGVSLQDQIRRKIVEAAVAGAFPLGCRLPSSRSLATELGVARNTVVLAYQRLLDDGFLVSRPRSGLYVNEGVGRSRIGAEKLMGPSPAATAERPKWAQRLRNKNRVHAGVRALPNWMEYPYPFIDGLFDPPLFPAAEWRETSRLGLSRAQIQRWATECGDADDPMLIEEIRAKLLMRRGISARPDEILITLGVQHGLFLIAHLLLDRTTPVGLEEPGYPEMLDLARARAAPVIHQPVDADGVVVDEKLDPCKLVYLTPSHQFPTGATLSLSRRYALLEKAAANDTIIVEDDSDCETNYGDFSVPALRGLDRNDRVIYLAGLAKVLTPGLRLGFMVAAAEFIAEARRIRRLTIRHPPLAAQRTAALFLSLGHYDATMLRLGRIFRERRIALLDALNHYLPSWVAIAPVRGGTTCWVHGPAEIDAAKLAEEAERHGVLIEPIGPYYGLEAPRNVFRMGVTGLSTEKIRPGVAALAELIRGMTEQRPPPGWSPERRLKGRRLRAALSDVRILTKTVYGEPCTIDLHRGGLMSGRCGFANEEVDTGSWEVDGDVWRRQWSSWAYGEQGAYHVVIEGDRIGWFSLSGRHLGSAVLMRL